MSLSGVTAAHLVVSDNATSCSLCSPGIGVALIIGVINGFVVVVMRIDSFIGTLATGSLVQAFISFVTGDNTINSLKLAGAFTTMSQGTFGGVIYPVYYALALAILLWLFMEYTATGRRLYATGFNPDAARLANIQVNRLRFCSLLTSAAISRLRRRHAGLLAELRLRRRPARPTCCPRSRRCFVGATQFKRAASTPGARIVAVLMLGTGTVGLGLVPHRLGGRHVHRRRPDRGAERQRLPAQQHPARPGRSSGG